MLPRGVLGFLALPRVRKGKRARQGGLTGGDCNGQSARGRASSSATHPTIQTPSTQPPLFHPPNHASSIHPSICPSFIHHPHLPSIHPSVYHPSSPPTHLLFIHLPIHQTSIVHPEKAIYVSRIESQQNKEGPCPQGPSGLEGKSGILAQIYNEETR